MDSAYIPSANDRDVLQPLFEAATEELLRVPAPLSVENVLASLVERMSDRVRAVVSFEQIDLDRAESDGALVMQLPIGLTDNECIKLASHLGLMAEDKQPYPQRIITHNATIPLTVALHEYLGDQAVKPLHLFSAAYLKDKIYESQGVDIPLDESLDDITAQDLPRLAPSDADSQFNNEGVACLAELSGFAVARRLQKKGHTVRGAIDACMRLLRANPSLSSHVLLMIQNHRLACKAHLAEVMINHGYAHFRTLEQMSDHDLWKYIQRGVLERSTIAHLAKRLEAMTKINAPGKHPPLTTEERIVLEEVAVGTCALRADDEEDAQSASDSSTDMLLLRDASEDDKELWRRAEAWLKKYPEENRRSLSDALDCARYRRELQTLRLASHIPVLAAKEREVAMKVFGEICRFPYEKNVFDEDFKWREGHLIGTPTYAVRERTFNCFTGPWAMATFLMECGLFRNQLYYCDIHEGRTGEYVGIHGAILVTFSDSHAVFLDYGNHDCSKTIGASSLPSPSARATPLERLLQGNHQALMHSQRYVADPVHMHYSARRADKLNLYRDFHVLPLNQGLAAMSLLNLGLTYKREGNTDEASAAFELGLVSHPCSPDLLVQSAMIALEREELHRAERFLGLAIEHYRAHPLARYLCGVLALKQADTEEALRWFQLVADDRRNIWGDDTYRTKAREYCESRNARHALDFAEFLYEAEETYEG